MLKQPDGGTVNHFGQGDEFPSEGVTATELAEFVRRPLRSLSHIIDGRRSKRARLQIARDVLSQLLRCLDPGQNPRLVDRESVEVERARSDLAHERAFVQGIARERDEWKARCEELERAIKR